MRKMVTDGRKVFVLLRAWYDFFMLQTMRSSSINTFEIQIEFIRPKQIL